MKHKSVRKVIFAVLLIFLGEILIFFGHPVYGLAVHIINLQVIFIMIVADKNYLTDVKEKDIKPIFQSFILLLLLRIVNMSMPIFFISSIFWISIIYGIMFIPIYSLIKNQKLSLKEIGLQCKQSNMYIPSYLPVILLIGYLLSLVEFQIIHPESIVANLSLLNLLLLILIMFFIVGLVEELIFRSILQTRLENAFGMKYGLILASVLYGIMHSGYGNVYGVIFAGFAGLIIGLIFQKTRCLPFVVGIHGTINTFVFGIFPLLLQY